MKKLRVIISGGGTGGHIFPALAIAKSIQKEVKNVDFKVGGKTKVSNVSFAIENEGDIICLLGPSGIGKTTILRTIAGLEKIKKGSIELKGSILSSEKKNLEPEEWNKSLAFQENSLFPHYTVEKNIQLGAEAKKLNGKKKINPKKITSIGIVAYGRDHYAELYVKELEFLE